MGRSETLFRKAEAIQGLCGARVALMVFDSGGAVKTWPKEAEAVRATIDAYRMFVAKGKKRLRAAVDPPRPSDSSFLDLGPAMALKLEEIKSRIKTLAMTMSSSEITSSEWFWSTTQSSFGGGGTAATDLFLAATQSGLDFMDYAAAAAADLPFESYLVDSPAPPQESPAATSGSIPAAAMPGSESEIIISDDSTNSPILIIDEDEDDEIRVQVEQVDSPIFKGLMDLSTTPFYNLEDYNFGTSSPGTYTDMALMMTNDCSASFLYEE